ncbi:MAG: bifunctional phosphopantothenoylcysteine decarboxylase/phosphopantothenate--cysteine ligase CoaBC [Solobacterium sp.]|jgi:phosphopantothenoylcysteine decarboxylase/phosphopantothenate--cysteine ligase|nr:bifunctional phosphopantothenoylcysteine decarboxylase/phosphopantothenate--cysteine ligase CoaBC [Solobacterium sp.]MCH4266509.1 bifunctional phosphopantothenoylcysteine decarboxylase/phosphopantothenate--cysteine ligase CoaBC [Solobacterium sp.]
MEQNSKCILVGVTGGIAAYKTCTLVSSLKKKGYEVHVLMTEAAQQFVTPLTMQTLSSQRVITDMFSTAYEPEVHHVSLAKKADLFVIAPASADIIAKIAHGIADDMLTTTFLAAGCPKLIVPAMNTGMLDNPITQDNLERCRHYGMHVMESGSGYLACGDTGQGRMMEPEEIEDAVLQLLETDHYLAGRKVLITAGPTCEALDPVRYLTNHSSGKMGYALAKAARNAGAEVTLVAGVNHLPEIRGIETVHVTAAEEMYQAVMKYHKEMDVLILAAAVADYRPKTVSDNKIHKSDSDLSIELERTKDILASLGQNKQPGQTLIGFAMETEDLLERAEQKRRKKNCDYIIANNVKEPGAGFEKDTNKVTILGESGKTELGLMSKEDTAAELLRICLKGE